MPCDYKNYPKDWKEMRKRILERENHKCKFCDVPNYAIIYRPIKKNMKWEFAPEGMICESDLFDGIKFTKIILTIAHLDHDKENHEVSDDRLAALCQRCHLLFDIDRHVANRKANKLKKQNETQLSIAL